MNIRLPSVLSKYAAPFMWAAVFISSLMLLGIYDAETFLVSCVLLITGILGAIYALPKGQPLTMTKSPVVLLLFAFWALAFVSVIFSESSFTSFIFFCFVGMLPMGFIYAALVPDKDRLFSAAFKVGAGVYAALSVMCLVQYFFIPELLPYGRTQYPFGNPNSLAGYLSLGFFCIYGVIIKLGASKKQYALFGLALLVLTAILTTGSRGGTLALITGMGVLTFLLRAHVGKQKRLHFSFLGFGVLSFIGLTVFAPSVNWQTPGDVLAGSISGKFPLLWNRPEVWASTWEIVKDHFWTGTGIGTFFQVYPGYRGNDAGTAGHMAHNDVLQFWAEMGVAAPLIFISLMGAAIVKTVKIMRVIPPADDRRIMIAAVFCALGAMVLHTQISFHFYVLPMLFVSGTMLAFWFYQAQRLLPYARWQVTGGSRNENLLVKMCLGALVLCCAFMFVRFQTSEVLTDLSKAEMRRGNLAGFVSGINAAGDLSFKRNARALALASTVPSGIVKANGANMDQNEVFKLLTQAEGLLDRSLENNLYLASSYHEKALVAEMAMRYVPERYTAHHKGNPPDARALMEKSVHYNPLHANTRVRLAEMMISQGEEDEAYALLKDGLTWNYLGTKGMGLYQKLAGMALERGDKETQLEALTRIQKIYKQAELVKARNAVLDKKFGPFSVWGEPEK